MFHLELKHVQRGTADDYWRPCDEFQQLIECKLPGCLFFTTSAEKLELHKMEHTKLLGPEEEVKVTMGDLTEAMQRVLIQDQRRRMEEPSLLHKNIERRHGLVSPPFRITEDMAKPTRAVRPERVTPPSMDEEQPQRPRPVRRFQRNWPDTPEQREAPEEEPVARRTRNRPRTGGNTRKEKKLEDPGMYYHRNYMTKIVDVVRNIQPPPRMGRPVYLPLERAVRLRPLARYVAEFSTPRQTIFMFFHELTPPMTGSVVRREEDDIEGSPVVAGIAVAYVTGSPEAKGQMHPLAYNWRHKAILYDVFVTPWAAMRKLQVSELPRPHLYLVINPEIYKDYETEVIQMM